MRFRLSRPMAFLAGTLLVAGCSGAPGRLATAQAPNQDQANSQATAHPGFQKISGPAARHLLDAIDVGRAAITLANRGNLTQSIDLLKMARANLNAIDAGSLSAMQKGIVDQIHASIDRAIDNFGEGDQSSAQDRNDIIRDLASRFQFKTDEVIGKL